MPAHSLSFSAFPLVSSRAEPRDPGLPLPDSEVSQTHGSAFGAGEGPNSRLSLCLPPLRIT
jgi:hypothetical protein